MAVGKNAEQITEIVKNLLGGTLVTIQTGEAGKVVNKVLVAQDVYYEGPNPTKEFYLSILLDRAKACNVIMYSTEGGMDIEEVAHNTPDRIFKGVGTPRRRTAALPGAQDRIQPRSQRRGI